MKHLLLYSLGGYTSTYCKDKTPTTCEKLLQCDYNGDQRRFEDEFCSVSKAQEVTCLKTCRRCLSLNETVFDQNKNRQKIRCEDVYGKNVPDLTNATKLISNLAQMSSPNISIILFVIFIVFPLL